MYPITLQLTHTHIALIGDGPVRDKRWKSLLENGAKHVALFSSNALPSDTELSNASVVMLADVPEEDGERLATLYRAHGKLVNWEDHPAFCDFHFASFFARGDFAISIHTNGKSPALASVVRESLEIQFGDEWSELLETLSHQRTNWQREGKSHADIRALTKEFLGDHLRQKH